MFCLELLNVCLGDGSFIINFYSLSFWYGWHPHGVCMVSIDESNTVEKEAEG